MNTSLREVMAIWQSRNGRTGGDLAFVAYAVIMVGIVAVAPLARALWLSATSAEGTTLLLSVTQPANISLAVAAFWAGAFLVGRERGPALLAPFPLHVLATSALSRSTVFRGPLLRSAVMVTASTTAVFTFVAVALASQGLGDAPDALAFAAQGALVGVIATGAWLFGQALPRTATLIAAGLVGLAGFGVIVTNMVTLAVIATVLTLLMPTLLNKLTLATLTTQAARCQTAAVFASGLDFASATATYRGRPSMGRRLSAVRPGRSLATTFIVRDAVGAIRTPGRLVVGITTVAVAGVLVTLAFAPATPSVLLGAAAGLALFAGLGPITDGIRHAASVAADLPLYGISDGALLAFHLLFPLGVVIAVLTAAVLIGVMFSGTPAAAPLMAALALGVLTLVARVSTAFKGMLPSALLTPIPTAAGDISIWVQLGWALDGVIIAMIAGAAAVVLLQMPALFALVSLTVVGVGISRWRARNGHTV